MTGGTGSWAVTQDGIRYRTDVDPDDDATVADYDNYSPSDKEAFNRGEWQFAGVTVTPEVNGTDRDPCSFLPESLWAVEYGTMPAETEPWQGGTHPEITIGRDELASNHPVPDMSSEVRANLARLRDALTRILAEPAGIQPLKETRS
jgi:hypothetical protein